MKGRPLAADGDQPVGRTAGHDRRRGRRVAEVLLAGGRLADPVALQRRALGLEDRRLEAGETAEMVVSVSGSTRARRAR